MKPPLVIERSRTTWAPLPMHTFCILCRCITFHFELTRFKKTHSLSLLNKHRGKYSAHYIFMQRLYYTLPLSASGFIVESLCRCMFINRTQCPSARVQQSSVKTRQFIAPYARGNQTNSAQCIHLLHLCPYRSLIPRPFETTPSSTGKPRKCCMHYGALEHVRFVHTVDEEFNLMQQQTKRETIRPTKKLELPMHSSTNTLYKAFRHS